MGSDEPRTVNIEADEQFVDGLLAKAIRHLRISPETAEVGQTAASLAELQLVGRHCLRGLRLLQTTPGSTEYVDANRTSGELSLKFGPS
jgi:hypothetical protein